MAPLGYALLATELTGSYQLGGVLMAVFVIAEVLGATPVSRLLDRIGVARGLRSLLVLAALCLSALTGLLLFTDDRVPTATLFVLVAMPGSVAGAISGGFRALLPYAAPAGALERAIAVDAVLMDLVILAGPLVVAGLANFGAPFAVGGMALAYLVAAVMVRSTTVRRPERTGAPFPVRAIARWLACAFAVGQLLSVVEVGTLALASRLSGGAGTAAALIAVVSGASATAGICYAWLAPRLVIDARARARLCLLALVAGGLVIAFASGWPAILGGLTLLGIGTAPLVAIVALQLQQVLPAHRRAEGFGVLQAVQGVGFGLGALSIALLALPVSFLAGVFSCLVAFLASCQKGG